MERSVVEYKASDFMRLSHRSCSAQIGSDSYLYWIRYLQSSDEQRVNGMCTRMSRDIKSIEHDMCTARVSRICSGGPRRQQVSCLWSWLMSLGLHDCKKRSYLVEVGFIKIHREKKYQLHNLVMHLSTLVNSLGDH